MGKKKALKTKRVEDFYLYCALNFGPPRSDDLIINPRHYAWFANSLRAQQFTHCVTSYGEAKSRTVKWFKRYSAWYQEQERKHRRTHVDV